MSEIDWRDLPSLSALRAFEATARLGSFAAAARSLNVTHAAVAQQVRGLERELSLSLTQKSGRGIRLTPEGMHLAEALSDGFGRIAVGVGAARAADQTRGLRVSATPGIATKVLLPKLAEFWQEEPEIAVTIVPDRRSVDLVAEGFDLAIRAIEFDDEMPGTESCVLVRCPIIAVGAPSLFADGPPDPAVTPWLTRDRFELALLTRAGFDTDALVFRDVGPPTLEPAAARMGYGLMICPEIMVETDLDAGELIRLPDLNLGEMAYHAVTPRGPLRKSTQIYVSWLKRQLQL